MNIAIASGKGGTGKTTLSVSLAVYLSRQGFKVSLFDCDVEEPNVNLFLKSSIAQKEDSTVLVPSIDEALCTGCGKCEDICGFSSIVMIKNKPLFLKDMCHSCGGCALVCLVGAVAEIRRSIGYIEHGEKDGVVYTGGVLNISEHMSPPLIKNVIRYTVPGHINIFDAPPGTSCPPVSVVSEADYTILVTEPTPFGLHDLTLACGMARALEKPFGVVINRAGTGFIGVEEYCARGNISLLASIPHDRGIAEQYARGDFIEAFIDRFSESLACIAQKTGMTKEDGL